ncbi:FtsX-like permease family protein [Fulvivirgaceae bacterium BMA12]|uniref:FtsX-like permease family protein n=1 Tax=Agaribacillus aureus TaxID=3051825 RepID=A0ABT8KZL2_9BACT|nr:FtsX-like permease family protein [Fulvivirgaceae bacterium BMA12]
MNLSYFISKRINKAQSGSFSAIIHKIAIASIGVGLGIMIISFLILDGFKRNIIEKNFSFSGHLNITKFTLSGSYEEQPISVNSDFFRNHKKYDFIDHLQVFSHKFGLLKTSEGVSGALLKGVGRDFDTTRFNKIMVSGSFIKRNDSTYSKDIVISRKLSRKLRLEMGDDVVMYFIQKPPRQRKLKVRGIYDSGLEEFDDRIIMGDIEMIQRLNGWEEEEVGGFELFIKDFDQLDLARETIEEDLDFDLYARQITDQFVQIFDWLTLVNRQVYLFIALILFVACFNMASILLILIMERTQMIGILKALGADNLQIRKLFIYNGIWIVLKGMLLGNIVGVGLAFLQYRFQLIPLNYETYFMHYVPIEWNWIAIIALNILTLVVVSAILIIPSIIIARIQPIKSIRFD